MSKILLFVTALIFLIESKQLTVEFPLTRFIAQEQFMYVTKMDFGIGQGNLSATLRMEGQPKVHRKNFSMWIGLLLDEQYEKMSRENLTCSQKQEQLRDSRPFDQLQDNYIRHTSFNIGQTVREHLWYVFVFNCNEYILQEKDNRQLHFEFSIQLLNNGSHFGEDQHVLWMYICCLVIGVIMIPTNIIKVVRDYREGNRDTAHILITIGIVTLCLSYFYKIIHLAVYYFNGEGVTIMDIFFLMTKTISECIVLSLLMVIGWGWSINYNTNQNQDLYLPLALVVTIVQIVTSVLGKITDDFETKYHYFDCVTGLIILFFRCIIAIVFVVGVRNTLGSAGPKAQQFVKEFGILGFLYIASHPIAVIFCELVFPPYMQNQALTGIVEFSHTIANGLLTYMLTSKRSAYRSLDFTERTIFTPVNNKVF